MKRIAAVALSLLLSGCIEIVSLPARKGDVSPEVSNVLLRLIDDQEKGVVTSVDYNATSLGIISTLPTPSGLRLRLRYQELGISLVEALKLTRDLDLLARLLELAKWSQGRRVRSEALVTVAAFSDPADVSHFEQALTDQDVGIRFAAVEALQKWGRDESLPLLRKAAADPWSPLIRVFAAQAELSLGDQGGLAVLYSSLEDRSWIVRALAARYLGDYAEPDDYTKLLKVVDQESRNDFVSAEAAIATLKLLAKKSDKPVPAPTRNAKDPAAGRYNVATDDVVEMEPLVIRPPRLNIPESVRVAQSVNNRLIQLIQTRINAEPDPTLQNDSNLQDLNRMVTPEGFALQIRYSQLTVAVAEGLAGTTDPLLRAQLTHLTEADRNALTRSTAMLSLAYARNREDVPIITRAFRDPSAIVRFAAMEATEAGRFKELVPDLLGTASSDDVPVFRVYAIQALLEFGDASARDLLLSHLDDQDWPARAMAYWLLGRYGETDDQTRVTSQFGRENNSFVLAELALASQRLAPHK